MKSWQLKPMLAVLVLGLGLVCMAGVATAWEISDFQVNGTGVVNFTCQTGPLTPNCISNSGGEVTGAVTGTYTLSLAAGPAAVAQSSAGVCFPANGTGQITAATGDVLNFKTVGWLCEEALPSFPYHYNGTYRIDAPLSSGTGQFATAAGGGSLTGSFEKEFDGTTFIKLDGTIKF